VWGGGEWLRRARGRGEGVGPTIYIWVVLPLSRGAGQQEDLSRDITILGSNRRGLIFNTEQIYICLNINRLVYVLQRFIFIII
jgi:hypothetical protein